MLYHYCDFANAATLEPRQIVGSLVRQLAEQPKLFPSSIRDSYYVFSRSSPAIDILVSFLHELIERYYDAVYVVIDGVDECSERQSLLRILHAVEQHPSSVDRLKILVSSRPEYDLRKAWSMRSSISITPEDVEDSLRTHVRLELAKSPKLSQLTTATRLDLGAQLVSRAEGMFLSLIHI